MSHAKGLEFRFEAPPESGDPKELISWLDRLSRGLTQALEGYTVIELAELHEAPEKPRAGLIALADGTDWNPGSGAGVYAYYGGAWNKLG